MYSGVMCDHMDPLSERFVAIIARERFLARMDHQVLVEVELFTVYV